MRPPRRLVAAAGTPAVPVVGAGGERGGLAATADLLDVPVLAGGVLGSLDGPGVAGRVTEFDEPAVSLGL